MGKGATTAGPAPMDKLFTKTDPAVDGDDCLHDCDGCVVKYPRGFKIEESDLLYGHVNEWSTHVLIATSKADWVRDSADEKGSVMEAIAKADKPTNGVSCFPFTLSLPACLVSLFSLGALCALLTFLHLNHLPFFAVCRPIVDHYHMLLRIVSSRIITVNQLTWIMSLSKNRR